MILRLTIILYQSVPLQYQELIYPSLFSLWIKYSSSVSYFLTQNITV
uniref:Uncharacterized protein n=1 Tax=Amphimedon queenslandica TaxID=400682 RepID=A0A1X7TRQ4_AMPQE